ncbi:MAG: DUF3144 domain-containing protein [Hyphomicrobiales bacterium]|nr:DUF3144 domain-containing protein [Hyphomicrobiales bacterium]
MPHDHDHDHDHGHDHRHDHGHDHGDGAAVQVANAVINLANDALGQGLDPVVVAQGLRHAAANFSAFAFFRDENLPKDPNALVEEFVAYLEHYLDRHKPRESPGESILQTIARAREDF